jgi:hypothetical protein
LDLRQELRRERRPYFEQAVLIGANVRLACRAIFVHLPPTVAGARRRKAKRAAQKRGHNLTSRTLELMAWSIYITNVPTTMLSLHQVVLLYSVRWQIELVFKLWKSECALDRIAGLRRERVLCELYAKMIGIVLIHWFVAPLRLSEVELSVVKACRILQRAALRITQALKSPSKLSSILEGVVVRMKRYATKDKRKTHLSTLHQLKLEQTPT